MINQQFFFRKLALGALVSLLASISSFAQTLQDNNGNGVVSAVAIGDSLTSGLGDVYPPGLVIEQLNGTEFGEGYPGRLSRYLGIPVENEGIPGEEFLNGGADRYPSEILSSQADLAILFEGLNDSINTVSSGAFSRSIQRISNVSASLNRSLMLVTLPTPCCSRAGREPFINSYNQEIRYNAAINSLLVADIAKAWETSCQNKRACELFNVPEGLHPNKLGYDVIAQTMAATLLGIDIFAPSGAAELASAIGVPIDQIKVKPAAVN